MKKLLTGHTSPETAYVVDDYPYGFRLRTSIRYWLEHHPKRGTRFVSQTINPKTNRLNKPKASTYADIAGAMFLDEVGHVQWSGLSYYPEATEFAAWLATFAPGLPDEVLNRANKVLLMKRNYERAKATGMDCRYAGIVASLTDKGVSYEEALARVNVGIQKAATAVPFIAGPVATNIRGEAVLNPAQMTSLIAQTFH